MGMRFKNRFKFHPLEYSLVPRKINKAINKIIVQASDIHRSFKYHRSFLFCEVKVFYDAVWDFTADKKPVFFYFPIGSFMLAFNHFSLISVQGYGIS